MEEIGVDLTSDKFCLLGRLNDRMPRRGEKLVVSTFVFAALDGDDIVLKVSHS